MEQKNLGIFLIIVGIALAALFYKIKLDEEETILTITSLRGDPTDCFLEDGTCLHQQQSKTYIVGEAFALVLFSLGVYLLFFDKTKQILALQAEQNLKVAGALQKAEEEKKKDEKFTAFLAGFSEDERKILEAIHEQEGILQSTLRFRAGLTKTDVSLILKKFEEKGIVTKKPEGNTNKVYLRKVF